MMRFCLVSMLLVMTLGVAQASIDVYEFSSEDNRQRYLELTRELRCPKCQNQDIADSNAPIAQDMRREVHRLVEQGESSDSVVDFMVERFGEFVSYKPKVTPATYALWYGPFVFLGLGILVVVLVAMQRRRQRTENESETLSSEPEELGRDEQEKLAALLKESAQEDSTRRGTSDQSGETP